MIFWLQRHPVPVVAHFDRCLVLTYAAPASVLSPLLPPGLQLDTFGPQGEFGFLAVALVQTRQLRPALCPRWMGQDFFLSGYRIFARFDTGRRVLRGLRILRSDTDRTLMRISGNLLTHYNYRSARVDVREAGEELSFRIHTPQREADLDVSVHLSSEPAGLPVSSCFVSLRDARRFAGPLPYTFDYERQTNSIIVIRAQRRSWRPTPVRVTVRENTFLDQPPFGGHPVSLASAFYLADIPYRWERGVMYPLGERQMRIYQHTSTTRERV